MAYTGRPSKPVVCGGGGKGTPYKGLYGEAMTDRGTIIRSMKGHEYEVNGRVGKSVILVCKKTQKS